MRVDVEVIEAVEANVGYATAASGFKVAADSGKIKARRIVEEMLDRENPALSSVSPITGRT